MIVMSRLEIECEYECPHCHAGWVIGDAGIYTDDIEDECTTTCDKCGGEFQLRCVSVDVEMEATILPETDDDSPNEDKD